MSDEENRPYPDQYMMRFPEGMRDQLKAAAKENGRALNAEIIARLEAYVSLQEQLKQITEQLKEAHGRINIERMFKDAAVKQLSKKEKELEIAKSQAGQTHALFDTAVVQVKNFYINLWKILVNQLPTFQNSSEVALSLLNDNNVEMAKKVISDLHDDIQRFASLDMFKEPPPEHEKINKSGNLQDPELNPMETNLDIPKDQEPHDD